MSRPERREVQVFAAALELPTPAEQAAYVRGACAGDESLRRRVEALLRAHATPAEAAGAIAEERAGPPEPGPDAAAATVLAPVTEKAGDRIGRYRILQQIGEGGCGIVYLAEQEEPVRRRVALKVIKLGMDTRSVVARFEAERQALALMDHPNIAKVLDAGATETGRPFFVMELVRGVKITDYCDEAKLPTLERLELFIQVCQAIQHAHLKGIIHRDLKPSNVLVTVNDGRAVPKVIDFGIAKATTDQRLTDRTLFTAYEQFIGTPAYMSPEQAVMTSLDIDTRSDVYSLGVLLYELLTGRTPFDAKELLDSGFDAMRQTIREKEPARPSTRLSTLLEADLTTMAQRRQVDAPRLIQSLRGDLDWIVMKALEKDRTRRYETTAALAGDIRRYLHHEPVEARPPSSRYRLQKLIRRNKTLFAAAAAVALALAAGFGLSLYAFVQERHAHQRAVGAEQEQVRLRQRAEERAELGQHLAMAGLLLSEGRYDEAETAMNGLTAHPASAAIFNVLGSVHVHRGQWQNAVTNFAKVVEFLPTNHMAYHYLAPLLVHTGDGDGYRRLCQQIVRQFATTSDATTAERMAKDCLILPPEPAILQAAARLADTAVASGPQHPAWGYFQFVKGLAEYRLGRFASAVDWLKPVVEQTGHRPRRLAAYSILAMAQQQLKEFDLAEASLRQALDSPDATMAGLDRKDLGDEWTDWIIAHYLMAEATLAVRGAPRR